MSFVSAGRCMRHLTAIAVALAYAPAHAAERDFCPERPGLDTPPCIVDPGRLSLEASLVDWTHDRQTGARTDTVLVGDTLLRLGLTERLEAQFGWTAYGHVRVRDESGISRSSSTGDVALAFKFGLLHPDGQGTSVALKPYVTLPTGGRAIGAGTWSGGLLVPLSFSLAPGLQITATPEIDAAADQDRHGRHLAFGSAGGVQLSLAKTVSLSLEAQILRDEDPAGHQTNAVGQASLAWQADRNTQLDVGIAGGLNRTSPDFELIAGVARRF